MLMVSDTWISPTSSLIVTDEAGDWAASEAVATAEFKPSAEDSWSRAISDSSVDETLGWAPAAGAASAIAAPAVIVMAMGFASMRMSVPSLIGVMNRTAGLSRSWRQTAHQPRYGSAP